MFFQSCLCVSLLYLSYNFDLTELKTFEHAGTYLQHQVKYQGQSQMIKTSISHNLFSFICLYPITDWLKV